MVLTRRTHTPFRCLQYNAWFAMASCIQLNSHFVERPVRRKKYCCDLFTLSQFYPTPLIVWQILYHWSQQSPLKTKQLVDEMVAWQQEGFLDPAVWKFLPEKISLEALPENLEELQSLPPPTSPTKQQVKGSQITQHNIQNIQQNQFINLTPEAVHHLRSFFALSGGPESLAPGFLPQIADTQRQDPIAKQHISDSSKPEDIPLLGNQGEVEVQDSVAQGIQQMSLMEEQKEPGSSQHGAHADLAERSPRPHYPGGAKPKVKPGTQTTFSQQTHKVEESALTATPKQNVQSQGEKEVFLFLKPFHFDHKVQHSDNACSCCVNVKQYFLAEFLDLQKHTKTALHRKWHNYLSNDWLSPDERYNIPIEGNVQELKWNRIERKLCGDNNMDVEDLSSFLLMTREDLRPYSLLIEGKYKNEVTRARASLHHCFHGVSTTMFCSCR